MLKGTNIAYRDDGIVMIYGHDLQFTMTLISEA